VVFFDASGIGSRVFQSSDRCLVGGSAWFQRLVFFREEEMLLMIVCVWTGCQRCVIASAETGGSRRSSGIYSLCRLSRHLVSTWCFWWLCQKKIREIVIIKIWRGKARLIHQLTTFINEWWMVFKSYNHLIFPSDTSSVLTSNTRLLKCTSQRRCRHQ
jgi:hypothetical protein